MAREPADAKDAGKEEARPRKIADTRIIRDSVTITYRAAKRIVVGVIGFTLLLIGLALVFTPGPGALVIILGLAILGIEFEFARRWLETFREKSRQAAGKLKRRRNRDSGEPEEEVGDNGSGRTGD